MRIVFAQSLTGRIAYPFRIIAYSLMLAILLTRYHFYAERFSWQLHLSILLCISFPHLMHWAFAYVEKRSYGRQLFLLPDAFILGTLLHLIGHEIIPVFTLNTILISSHIALRGWHHLWLLLLAEILGWLIALAASAGQIYFAGSELSHAILCSLTISAYLIYFSQQAYKHASSLRQSNRTIQEHVQLLEHQKEELKSLHEKQTYLMHMIAHDLKSPLNNLDGLLELLQNTSPHLNPEQQDIVQHMKKSIQKQKQLIEKILNPESRQTGRLHIQTEQFDLKDLLLECSEQHQLHIKKKGIHLRLDIPNDVPLCIRSDKKLCYQIIDNLLSNAIKYSYPGGHVQLRASSIGNYIILSIRDEGPGIAESEQNKLFQAFQQLNPRPTQDEDSTGLGLYIAKTLSEEIGATISFRSRIGHGTIFYVIFPECLLV